MFDNEIRGNHGRAGKFLLITGLAYAAILLVAGVASIFWWNPRLVEALDVSTMLAPPPPPSAPAPKPAAQPTVEKKSPVRDTFAPPKDPPKVIPDPKSVIAKPVVVTYTGVPGAPNSKDGVPGAPNVGPPAGDPPPPPPPAPKPAPVPTPVPTPEPPKIIKLSGGVIQGSALNRVQPQYPPIAKAARVQGAVQVQVTISEEGRVIEASVVSGHPLLREASLQAARQWRFKPTELTGVPVKVQGVLTFNFTLQ